jgi:hypothetical protein
MGKAAGKKLILNVWDSPGSHTFILPMADGLHINSNNMKLNKLVIPFRFSIITFIKNNLKTL